MEGKIKEFDKPEELLPDWGPYSKKYMGVSKVVGEAPIQGARFDCVVHPMLANSGQPAPNVTFPSSWHVWEAAPDLSYFAYRVELEWKDRVWADVSFSRVDEHTRLVRTEYVNNTDMDQNCVLNYYLAMEYPWKRLVKVSCEKGFALKKVVDYDDMAFAVPRPWDHLMPDGLHRGEFFDPLFFQGRGFGDRTQRPSYCAEGSPQESAKAAGAPGDGQKDSDPGPACGQEKRAFGQDKGDRVSFSVTAAEEFDRLSFRYRTTGEECGVFGLTVSGAEGRVYLSRKLEFACSREPAVVSVPVALEGCGAGAVRITLVSEGKGGVEFDFAAFHSGQAPLVVRTLAPEYVPRCEASGKGFLLRYEGVGESFGFLPLTEKLRMRRIPTGTLEDGLVSRLSQADPSFDQVTETFTSAFEEKRSDEGFYQNFLVHSIFIPAGGRHVEYALVGDFGPEKGRRSKAAAQGREPGGEAPGALRPITRSQAEALYETARRKVRPLDYNGDGEGYTLSNRILQATLLTNVVYPIYRHGEWIIHHTPGKRWDSLYTWDSGFIGLGLSECEPGLAEYILDLYLSCPENEDFAFLMHGSPVPVQAYLYLELLQRSRDKGRLFSWYPRMKRYYSFLAGKSEGSVTDPFKSRLTTTFDYFYNCSGMDDLPPQVEMYRQKKQSDCAPALTTSQLIRMAKILKMTAAEQGLEEDVREYERDIALRGQALQRFAWDEESGYFGYVVHDAGKNPLGVFKTDRGENLSKGMDGVYPLVAGVCTGEQEERLLAHIFSEKEMFSRVGISAVDMSAGYYQPNGYWNGNVWFSHQWFLWKTMLDLGKGEEAFRIAATALDAWKREVDYSYYTFEMLNIATARGGWFHQFGGLSAPVNIWANAYYKPGTVNCGFDLWIHEQSYDGEKNGFVLSVTNYGDREGLLLAVLRDPRGDICATNKSLADKSDGDKSYAGLSDADKSATHKSDEDWSGADLSGRDGGGRIRAFLEGEEIPLVFRTRGAVEMRIPAGVRRGTLRVG